MEAPVCAPDPEASLPTERRMHKLVPVRTITPFPMVVDAAHPVLTWAGFMGTWYTVCAFTGERMAERRRAAITESFMVVVFSSDKVN